MEAKSRLNSCTNSISRWASIILIGLILPGFVRAEEELNNGEDFTRPLNQFQLRYQYQEKSDDVDESTFILRLDHPIPLSENWKISTRFDLPFVLTDAVSADNPGGETGFGLGDFLAQAALIETVSDRFAWGSGFRWVFPTASEDQFGTGKYQLVPFLGMRYSLPELSKGSFFQPIVRYDFSVAGDESRKDVSRFRFSPTLNIALPDRWYITLYPSQDIVLNNIGGHNWFVPADFLIGRHLNQRIVTGLEISIPIIKEFTLYDFKLEARLSYSF